jgi:hypothetical protein
MKPKICYFNKESIDELSWPNQVNKSLYAFVKDGVPPYIANVDTKIEVSYINNHLIPITVNDAEYSNCFVSSPYGQYVLYGMDEIENKALEKLFFTPFGAVLRWGKINRVVSCNNWLKTTNLYPNLEKEDVEDLVTSLDERYPHHAHLFRSLNYHTNPELCQWLKEFGYKLIASRIVYLFDPKDPEAFSSRMMKSDLKLLSKTSYEIVPHSELKPEDAPRLKELYDALYLDKYSKQNVQWTEAFFRLAIQTRALELTALRKNGKIDGIVGQKCVNKVMTAPLFGYDPQVSKEEGLYRLLSLQVALQAKEQGALLNQSSGAKSFKTLRRAFPVMEYSAVKTSHLTGKSKLTWNFLGTVVNKVGAPVMYALENR